jgi:hypothetical protein
MCEKEGPRPTELVTRKPVAIMTGTECTSSCDALAAMWGEFHLGPVVGKQPAHGFTSVRHELAVVGPGGRDLGLFRVALSSEGFVGAPALEGRPIRLDWEAPESWETRETWVDGAIKHADELLRTWK